MPVSRTSFLWTVPTITYKFNSKDYTLSSKLFGHWCQKSISFTYLQLFTFIPLIYVYNYVSTILFWSLSLYTVQKWDSECLPPVLFFKAVWANQNNCNSSDLRTGTVIL